MPQRRNGHGVRPMTPAGSGAVDRAAVWKQLGAPTDQIGSVNDPRTFDEYGETWNEKWLYLDESGEVVERVVLWNRYDFVGVFRLQPDGGAVAEPLAE